MENPFAKNAVDILNFRIQEEEKSSRLYEAMSLWLNDKGYTGAAKTWKKDAEGEMGHAQWAKDFLLDMGEVPKLPALPEPPHEFAGLPDVIRQSFAHEVLITQQCNDLANYSYTNGNHLLYQLAMKFLVEQQEELGKAQTYMDKLETFGEDKIAMKLFDTELGA
jgi:ferritin